MCELPAWLPCFTGCCQPLCASDSGCSGRSRSKRGGTIYILPLLVWPIDRPEMSRAIDRPHVFVAIEIYSLNLLNWHELIK